MRIGFYAGSFDPFTVGHLHIVKVASKIFDKVIVGIGVNPKKTRRFDKAKMKEAIENLLRFENIENFEVITFDGLTADIAKEYGAISSSMVFELLKRNKDVSKYIPKFVVDILKIAYN